jgi:hypothetical protein
MREMRAIGLMQQELILHWFEMSASRKKFKVPDEWPDYILNRVRLAYADLYLKTLDTTWLTSTEEVLASPVTFAEVTPPTVWMPSDAIPRDLAQSYVDSALTIAGETSAERLALAKETIAEV